MIFHLFYFTTFSAKSKDILRGLRHIFHKLFMNSVRIWCQKAVFAR